METAIESGTSVRLKDRYRPKNYSGHLATRGEIVGYVECDGTYDVRLPSWETTISLHRSEFTIPRNVKPDQAAARSDGGA